MRRLISLFLFVLLAVLIGGLVVFYNINRRSQASNMPVAENKFVEPKEDINDLAKKYQGEFQTISKNIFASGTVLAEPTDRGWQLRLGEDFYVNQNCQELSLGIILANNQDQKNILQLQREDINIIESLVSRDGFSEYIMDQNIGLENDSAIVIWCESFGYPMSYAWLSEIES